MTDAHGVAIICEREAGHTVAWVDARMSRHVPAGYFVEWWPQNCMAEAGSLVGGYRLQQIGDDMGPHTREWRHYWWQDWYDAVLWCRHDARRKERAA